ncbi:EamA-like transporter family protein [Paenibacillus cellulosilyticus]|uniref:EamA-like transporter family protein n=1 Tax=Paenibacillus cellulosilyticus TaxID=375489 RepID=A0A2V2YVM0_9BACL|nr:EamA family transporter [Paenibacillus cellulosilyticus]PWW00875.1 EamA-like transporter family protein [Paenibacillus cellulosilyticus]
MSKTISYLLLFGNVMLLVAGQILFKFGLQRAGGLQWLRIAQSPAIWSGLVLYGIATLLWFAVLTRLPLSIAYPMQSMAYVLGLLAAWFIFDETLSATKIAGCVVILIGVYLIAK